MTAEDQELLRQFESCSLPFAQGLFYSPHRRMDPRAKAEFVEPDLAPLPQIRQTGR